MQVQKIVQGVDQFETVHLFNLTNEGTTLSSLNDIDNDMEGKFFFPTFLLAIKTPTSGNIR